MNRIIVIAISSFGLLAGCEEPRPTPVTKFMEDPIAMEAAIIRCNADRDEMRHDQECLNAREAVRITEAIEERARRQQLEEQSERKLQALRRARDAADAALRRAEAERKRLEEEEYLQQFADPAEGEDLVGATALISRPDES
ncbi:MAG TPA: EexN family lipoprotein [Woeseiaceae bacterium]